MGTVEAGVIVVGGGTAGRAAALAAVRAGEDVVLLDEGRVAPLPGVRVRPGRVVWTVTPGFAVEALGPEGRETYQAPRLVSATGSIPRMVPFPGWTLRGVGALGDRVAGRRIVLAGFGSGLQREARRLGGRVVRVIDLARGEAIAQVSGAGRVERVKVMRVAESRASPRGEAYFLAADAVLVGYGRAARNGIAELVGGGVEGRERGEDGLGWRRLVRALPQAVEICPCEGITRRDIDAAVAAGAGDMNQLRAFTRCGMGLCQGRLCKEAASALVPGVWTVRPPLRPVPLEALLGSYDYGDIPVPTPAPL